MLDILLSHKLLIISTFCSTLLGGVASYFATFFFLKNINKKHKPEINISQNLIKTLRRDETQALQVKIINKTTQDISGVIFELEGIENLAPKNNIPIYSLSVLAYHEVIHIKKYDKKDENCHYAFRINLHNEDDILKDLDKYDGLRLSIKAICPYYNTSTVVSRDYTKNDILDYNHIFNSGDSLDVVNSSPITKEKNISYLNAERSQKTSNSKRLDSQSPKL